MSERSSEQPQRAPDHRRDAVAPSGMPLLAAGAAARLVGDIVARLGGPHAGHMVRPLSPSMLWRQVARRLGAPAQAPKPDRPGRPAASETPGLHLFEHSVRSVPHVDLVWRARPPRQPESDPEAEGFDGWAVSAKPGVTHPATKSAPVPVPLPGPAQTTAQPASQAAPPVFVPARVVQVEYSPTPAVAPPVPLAVAPSLPKNLEREQTVRSLAQDLNREFVPTTDLLARMTRQASVEASPPLPATQPASLPREATAPVEMPLSASQPAQGGRIAEPTVAAQPEQKGPVARLFDRVLSLLPLPEPFRPSAVPGPDAPVPVEAPLPGQTHIGTHQGAPGQAPAVNPSPPALPAAVQRAVAPPQEKEPATRRSQQGQGFMSALIARLGGQHVEEQSGSPPLEMPWARRAHQHATPADAERGGTAEYAPPQTTTQSAAAPSQGRVAATSQPAPVQRAAAPAATSPARAGAAPAAQAGSEAAHTPQGAAIQQQAPPSPEPQSLLADLAERLRVRVEGPAVERPPIIEMPWARRARAQTSPEEVETAEAGEPRSMALPQAPVDNPTQASLPSATVQSPPGIPQQAALIESLTAPLPISAPEPTQLPQSAVATVPAQVPSSEAWESMAEVAEQVAKAHAPLAGHVPVTTTERGGLLSRIRSSLARATGEAPLREGERGQLTQPVDIPLAVGSLPAVRQASRRSLPGASSMAALTSPGLPATPVPQVPVGPPSRVIPASVIGAPRIIDARSQGAIRPMARIALPVVPGERVMTGTDVEQDDLTRAMEALNTFYGRETRQATMPLAVPFGAFAAAPEAAGAQTASPGGTEQPAWQRALMEAYPELSSLEEMVAPGVAVPATPSPIRAQRPITLTAPPEAWDSPPAQQDDASSEVAAWADVVAQAVSGPVAASAPVLALAGNERPAPLPESSAPTSHDEQKATGVDLDDLAESVYTIIRRKLAVERERSWT